MSVSIPGDGRGMQAMSIAAARKEFHDLPERVQEEPVFVTRDGRPVLVILSFDQYEELWETIECLGEPTFAGVIQESLVRAGGSGRAGTEASDKSFGS